MGPDLNITLTLLLYAKLLIWPLPLLSVSFQLLMQHLKSPSDPELHYLLKKQWRNCLNLSSKKNQKPRNKIKCSLRFLVVLKSTIRDPRLFPLSLILAYLDKAVTTWLQSRQNPFSNSYNYNPKLIHSSWKGSDLTPQTLNYSWREHSV